MYFYLIGTSQNDCLSVSPDLYSLVQFPVLSFNNTRSWLYIVFDVNKNRGF